MKRFRVNKYGEIFEERIHEPRNRDAPAPPRVRSVRQPAPTGQNPLDRGRTRHDEEHPSWALVLTCMGISISVYVAIAVIKWLF